MNELIEDLTALIKKHSSKKHIWRNWDFTDVDHSTNKLLPKKNFFSSKINSKKKLMAVYVYINEGGKIIYIGKSKNLFSRLYNHFKESIKNNDIGTDKWKPFWEDRKYKFKIYFFQICNPNEYDELVRRFVELYLTIHHKPDSEYYSREYDASIRKQRLKRKT